MEFLSLPDDCLSIILSQCPLQQLFSLRTVSHRFNNLIQHIFATKRILKIFGSYYEMNRFVQSTKERYVPEDLPEFAIRENTDDVIIIGNPDSETLYQIPQRLPNATSIFINCTSFNNLDLSQFLEPWRPNLVSFGAFDLPKNKANLDQLWNTVNTMSSLRKLHLLIPPNYRLPDNFTVVSQLELFCLASYGFDLVPLYTHINNDITLLFSYTRFGPEQLEELIKRHPVVTKKIVGLDLGFLLSPGNRIENFSKLLQLSCDKLKELKFIDLMFGEHLPMVQMIPSLSKLTKLKNLAIYIGRNQLPPTTSAIYSLPRVSTDHLHLEVSGLTFKQFWQIIGLFTFKKLQLKHDFEFEKNQEKTNFIARLKREIPELKTVVI